MRLKALTSIFALGLTACGAGSSLDEYEDGVPDIVPSPIKVAPGDGDGTVGASCNTDENCDTDGLECLTTASVGVTITFPRGYCTQSCQNNAQCPADSACLTTARTCLQTCTLPSECRMADGYTCAAPPLLGSQKFCLPNDLANPLGGLAGTGGLLGGLFGGGTAGTGGGTGGDMGGFLGGLFGGTGGTGGGAGGDMGGFLGGLFGGTGGTGGGTGGDTGGFLGGLFGAQAGGSPGGSGGAVELR